MPFTTRSMRNCLSLTILTIACVTGVSWSQTREEGYLAIGLLLQVESVQQELSLDPQRAKERVRYFISELKTRPQSSLDQIRATTREIIGLAGETRLIEIYIQREGFRAVLNPYLANLIGISETRLNELYQVSKQAAEEAASTSFAKHSGRSIESAIARGKYTNAKVMDALEIALSPSELKSLRDLHGAPFELPDNFKRFGARSILDPSKLPEDVSETEISCM